MFMYGIRILLNLLELSAAILSLVRWSRINGHIIFTTFVSYSSSATFFRIFSRALLVAIDVLTCYRSSAFTVKLLY
ncbi:unnamed protein product [Amoebophrya sp. A25]|nr:unnamed protein product [Amoebophrya sp. A25]|eukprot:GSA25T00017306001.1